ncbi:TIGR02147 family protein [bacterium]|nr:TIGR02147 family protein [bacterium]
MGNVQELKPVNIYSYVDYRLYLKAMREHLKSTTAHFSDRYFAALAGLGSSSYFRMVLEGKRNLKSITATKFAQGLKLNKKETRYFELMVLFNQAKTEALRDQYFAEMMALAPKIRAQGIQNDQLEYVKNSLYVIIREMSILPHFKDDPVWIAENLYKNVKSAQVAEALALLERLGLVTRDQDGRLRHTHKALESPPDTTASEYISYHRQALTDAKEAITYAPYMLWDASSKTIVVSKNKIPQVMKRLREFQDELDILLQEDPATCDEVFQINMQLFPVTRTKVKR